MKLKLSLLIFCLLGIGIFSHAQDKKKLQNKKPTVENGDDAIPVTVTSTKKAHRLPPPPPRPLGKDGRPLPPHKIDVVKFAPPKIVKDKPAPPPPILAKGGKPLPPPKADVVKFAPPKIVKDKPAPPPPPKPKAWVKPFAPPVDDKA